MRHTMSHSGLGKKGQFMCDLVKKSEGGGMFLLSRGGVHWQGGPCFFFREGGSIGMGGGGGVGTGSLAHGYKTPATGCGRSW